MKYASMNTPKEIHSFNHSFKELRNNRYLTESLLGKQNIIENHAKTNFAQTVFNFVKLYLGIAVLTMPNSFSQCGIIEGILSITVVFALFSRTLIIQSDAAIEIDTKIRSLSELCLKVLGPTSYLLMNFFIM